MSESGFWELIVIFVLALLVIGPERLPEVAKKVGYWVGKVRRFVSKVRSDVESEFRTDELQRMLEEQSKEIQNLRTIVSEAHQETRHSVEEMDAAIKESVSEAQSALAEVAPSGPPQIEIPGTPVETAKTDAGKVGDGKASSAAQTDSADSDQPKGAPKA